MGLATTDRVLNAMRPSEFQAFASMLHAASGIHLGEMKMGLLKARMAKRLRALKIEDAGSYYDYIQNDESGLELERLVDVVTTNKTDFFREARHYSHLVAELLPAFLPGGSAYGRELRIWSAACSSGEEPYSLAMVLHEALQGKAKFKILATDISSRVLRKAEEGRYSGERIQAVPRDLRDRYFSYGVSQDQAFWEVGPQLKAAVQFSRFNLNDAGQYVFSRPFDAIFCRNVMIYFDRPTQEALVARLSAQLAPGGLLYTGFSESLIGIRHNLKAAGPSAYRKRGISDSV